MITEIFSNWTESHSELYGKHTVQLEHRLLDSGLFSEQALAQLIDKYPQELYHLTTMDGDPENPIWREGDLTGIAGEDIIDSLKNGQLWLNLRRAGDIDPRYGALLNNIFKEIENRVPGLETFKQDMGILISSPKSQVFYHADIPGQSLWQLQGRKKVYLYPNTSPFLEPEWMETMILGETEEEIPYHNWFDDHAEVIELEPGQMLHWPLNCPHRVVNEDCLNISVTTEHYTDDIRKSYAVHYANGVLRRLGFNPSSQSTDGLSVYPKAALAMACKMIGFGRAKQVVHEVDFELDPEISGDIIDIPAFAKA